MLVLTKILREKAYKCNSFGKRKSGPSSGVVPRTQNLFGVLCLTQVIYCLKARLQIAMASEWPWIQVQISKTNFEKHPMNSETESSLAGPRSHFGTAPLQSHFPVVGKVVPFQYILHTAACVHLLKYSTVVLPIAVLGPLHHLMPARCSLLLS